MMKRWMAMGMALCLTAASLAGCSGTKDAAESTQAEAETSAEEAQPPFYGRIWGSFYQRFRFWWFQRSFWRRF